MNAKGNVKKSASEGGLYSSEAGFYWEFINFLECKPRYNGYYDWFLYRQVPGNYREDVLIFLDEKSSQRIRNLVRAGLLYWGETFGMAFKTFCAFARKWLPYG